jgi:hypothetical protein
MKMTNNEAPPPAVFSSPLYPTTFLYYLKRILKHFSFLNMIICGLGSPELKSLA